MTTTERPVIVEYLRKNLQTLRRRLAGTQESWAERVGTSQSRISSLERGIGWEQLGQLEDEIRRLGGDPMELLRGEGGTVGRSPEDIELLHLWALAGREERAIVLATLRQMAILAGRTPRSSPGLE